MKIIRFSKDSYHRGLGVLLEGRKGFYGFIDPHTKDHHFSVSEEQIEDLILKKIEFEYIRA